jgi:hypothetical protein
MIESKELKVGVIVSVCVGAGREDPGSYRWRKSIISKVTDSYVEIGRGNRFDIKTGKEVESPLCGSPEHSSVFIDNDNGYWDVQGAISQIKVTRLWSQLEISARNQDIIKCVSIISDLAALLLAHPNSGS